MTLHKQISALLTEYNSNLRYTRVGVANWTNGPCSEDSCKRKSVVLFYLVCHNHHRFHCKPITNFQQQDLPGEKEPFAGLPTCANHMSHQALLIYTSALLSEQKRDVDTFTADIASYVATKNAVLSEHKITHITCSMTKCGGFRDENSQEKCPSLAVVTLGLVRVLSLNKD